MPMSSRFRSRSRCRCALAPLVLFIAAPAMAANQTDTLSPVHVGSSQPYAISVQSVDFGAADLPTLHSYAAGTYDGKWIMLAGRTNGLHGFGQTGQQNFPPQYQNKDVWVIDPVTRQSWHRALTSDTTLSPLQLAALSSTNMEFAQVGNHLYVAGGYGQGPTNSFQTYDLLSSIDLGGITQWVMNG